MAAVRKEEEGKGGWMQRPLLLLGRMTSLMRLLLLMLL